MPLTTTIRLALSSILANKLRSILTMLDIIIGVASVIALSAVGKGTTASVTKQVEGLGSNLITVSPGAVRSGGISFGQGSASTLTVNDAMAIQSEDPDVAAVAPMNQRNAQVVFESNNDSTQIQGTTANYLDVKSTPFQTGRFFLPQEVDNASHVAVLGSDEETALFSGMRVNPIGQTIEINGIPFTVIGVLAPEGSNGFQNQDSRIMVPITTAMNVLTGNSSVSTLNISAKSSDVMNQAQQEIESTLRNAHHLTVGQQDDFRIQNQASVLSTLQSVTGVLTTFLSGIAGISLVVGGIGIMNIMLVSVSERTREIGVRKAIGAKRRAILMQFLVEAIVLSFTGAIIGVLVGGLGAFIVGNAMSLGNIVSPSSILVSVCFAFVIGIVFGVYPARKAANLNPIDALRFE